MYSWLKEWMIDRMNEWYNVWMIMKEIMTYRMIGIMYKWKNEWVM